MEARQRDQSIDVARGVAIIAIVLGHVERGLASADLLPYDAALTIDRLLYLFHLATFAYLSGLFVGRSVEREGAQRLLRRRITLFVWLYLLWTLIQGSVRVAASSLANTSVTAGDILSIWIPEGQLWFLTWLIAVTTVAVVVQPWRSRRQAVACVAGAAILAAAVWGHDPLYVFTRGWALLLPFLIGCAITQARHAAVAAKLSLMVITAVVGAAVWLWVGLATGATTPTTGGAGRTVTTISLGVVGCLAGTLACLSFAALLARTAAAGVLGRVGRRSLEIFLAHIVVASGTRIVLAQLGVTDPFLHLAAGTVLGVVAPLLLAGMAERWGWTWLFGLPRRPIRKARTAHGV